MADRLGRAADPTAVPVPSPLQLPGTAAEAVLIAHQRIDPGRCLCGWAEWGRSYAAHQVDELRRAGLLAEDPVR